MPVLITDRDEVFVTSGSMTTAVGAAGGVLGKANLTTQYRMTFVNSAGVITESSSITTNADGDLQIGGSTVGSEKLYVGGDYYGAGKIGCTDILTVTRSSSDCIAMYNNATAAIDVGAGFFMGGSYTGTTVTAFAAVRGFKENGTDGNYAGYLSLSTRPNGGSQTEAVRINSAQQVCIGAIAPVGSEKLYVNGGGYFAGDVTISGAVLIGTTTAGASKLVVEDDSIQVNTAKTPATAGATGTTGQIAWDANYFYVCVATNTWQRVAHATW